MYETTIVWDETLSTANLSNENKTARVTNLNTFAIGNARITEGKWYWEYTFNTLVQVAVGVVGYIDETTQGDVKTIYSYDGNKAVPRSSYASSFGVSTIIGVLLDMDNGTIEFSVNGVEKGVAFSDLKQFNHVRPYFKATSTSTNSTNIVTSNDGFKYYTNKDFLPLDDIIILQLLLLKSNNKIYSLKSEEILHETKMTSNTAPAPFVVSASSVYSSTFPAWKAFNGDITTSTDGWVTANNVKTGWIQIDFSEEKKINAFRILARNGSDTNQLPKDFILYGSDDGVVFNEIKKISNISDWEQGKFKTFYINSVYKNRYYRIDISENNGGAYTAIGEIQYIYIENLTQLPTDSVDNFINYGSSKIDKFNLISTSKKYVLQDTVSENADGLWVQDIDRKPLSIKFE